ncbi:hypothetical protein FB567DRAFT_100511 [Paraphoma chrysanthemicola]|uniref:CFEM domain-containing protein n=1 Tax=Paraphoma chrysanthemicola TaxID=798071 RepID=A0A8K0R3F9_9PLEO|nr:hypothetical protein FB567DRAFT_100511 [Paraphoma chrysanthemicola]
MRLSNWMFTTCWLVYMLQGAYAQQADALLTALPSCAAACTVSWLPTSTCQPTDLACICNDAPLIASISACTSTNCTFAEGLQAANVTNRGCGMKPRDRSKDYVITIAVLLVFSVGLYILRLVVRKPFTPAFGLDDGIITVGVASLIALSAVGIQMALHTGFGRDFWSLTTEQVRDMMLYLWLSELGFVMVITCSKLTVLSLYLRIFPQTSMKHAVYAVMTICILSWIAFETLVVIQCLPVAHYWHQFEAPGQGRCIDANAFVWAVAGVHIVLDIIIVALPIPLITRLRLSTRKKLQVLSMFCVGIFVTIVGMIRLKSLVVFARNPNPSYELSDSAGWAMIEAHVGVVCACMPTARQYLQRSFPSIFGSSYDQSRETSHGYRHRLDQVADPASAKGPASTARRQPSITKTGSVIASKSADDDEIELVDSIGQLGCYETHSNKGAPSENSLTNSDPLTCVDHSGKL